MLLEEYQEKRNFEKTTEPIGDKDKDIKNKDIKDKDIKDKDIKDKDIKDKDIKDKDIKDSGEEKKKCTIFVIQEHHASHLHWDLRLEIDGVLKSWAVPKNPVDINYGTKRLAIQVEDHPFDYASFEGTIPKGEYGAGTVSIWDRGEFFLDEMGENKLTFILSGEKMRGRYALIKTPKMGKNSWLFFKI